MKLRLLLSLALCIALSQWSVAQHSADPSLFSAHLHVDGADTLSYRFALSQAARTSKDPLPLVIFLHGAGERGSDNLAQLRLCVHYFLDDSIYSRYPFALLVPQCPEDQRWVNTDWTLLSHRMESTPTVQMRGVFYLIDSLLATGRYDPYRVYVVGISMGGFGVWDALQRRPQTFAAAIPVCGGGDPAYVDRLLDIPICVFHGERDKLVKPLRSHAMYDAVKHAGGHRIRLTTYSDLGHLCWDRTFSTPGLFHWLFTQRKDAK